MPVLETSIRQHFIYSANAMHVCGYLYRRVASNKYHLHLVISPHNFIFDLRSPNPQSKPSSIEINAVGDAERRHISPGYDISFRRAEQANCIL
jgi:hypothetical protein